jgi:hypothetical protein
MTFWLGRPGTVLVALPHPGRGIAAPLKVPSKVTETIGGGQSVDRAPTGRRTYSLDWASLRPEQHTIVEEFQLGARGPGPHVLLDPWRRNHLTANQSAATSVSNDTTGFVPSAGETVASATTPVLRGPRALAWTIPSSATPGILTFTPPNGLTRWPTPDLATWTASVWLRGGGVDPIVTAGLAIVWRDTADAIVSTATGPTIATAAGAYAQASQAAAAPVGAVGFDLQLRVTTASISGSTIVYADQPMLDLNNGVRPWAIGTGIPLVSVTEADTTYRAPIRRSASMTLVEVG